jgi:FlaA1/EpsC-like NDP-sugar epimerase
MISTDKAVNPASIMGASKRLAEYVVTALGAGTSTEFVTVRFGNVIGSRGSAFPVFVEQIKRGGPVTITHPDMKRYFMTIQEAVALVLQAAARGSGGEVFVLDMGEPLRIVDIVNDLIEMNGLVPGKDIQIEYTGIREGEKLFEELLTAEEGVDSTEHEKIFRARLYARYKRETIETVIERLQEMNGTASKHDLIAFFKDVLPTFNPSDANGASNGNGLNGLLQAKSPDNKPFTV